MGEIARDSPSFEGQRIYASRSPPCCCPLPPVLLNPGEHGGFDINLDTFMVLNVKQRQVRSFLLMGTITAVGLLLRVAFLTSKSLWMDEGFTAFMARTDSHTFARLIRSSEMNMVAYYALMRLWAQTSTDEFWIRFFSVLASTATIPIVYLISKYLGGRRTGFIAALMMAVHPSQITYAQEARSYSLEVLLVSAAALCLVRVIETGSKLDWVGYLGVSVLAVYSQVLAVLAIAAQLPILALRSTRARLNRTSATLIVLTALALAPMMCSS